MSWALGDEGLAENLYYYIWAKIGKDPGFRGFSLPDTVLYKYHHPSYWFFTTLNNTIKKKKKDKLSAEFIEERFLKNVSESGIVATFMSTHRGKRVLEYLGVDEFKHFLYYRKKNQDGVLQKYIEPKGNSESVIELVWTPAVCLYEIRENIKNLYDLRYDMYERAVTYEAEDFHTKSSRLQGNNLKEYLKSVVDHLVQHISEVSRGKLCVKQMVLHLKIDSNDDLWLIRAASIRCASDKKLNPLNLNSYPVLPSTINSMKMSQSPQASLTLQKSVLCRNCRKPVEADRMYEITFKILVNSTPSNEIPKLIKRLHNKLVLEDYIKIKGNPLFLNKSTLVCDICYVEYAGNMQFNRGETNYVLGTQPLNPYKLNSRRESTKGKISRWSNRGQMSTSESLRPLTACGFQFSTGNYVSVPILPVAKLKPPQKQGDSRLTSDTFMESRNQRIRRKS